MGQNWLKDPSTKLSSQKLPDVGPLALDVEDHVLQSASHGMTTGGHRVTTPTLSCASHVEHLVNVPSFSNFIQSKSFLFVVRGYGEPGTREEREPALPIWVALHVYLDALMGYVDQRSKKGVCEKCRDNKSGLVGSGKLATRTLALLTGSRSPQRKQCGNL